VGKHQRNVIIRTCRGLWIDVYSPKKYSPLDPKNRAVDAQPNGLKKFRDLPHLNEPLKTAVQKDSHPLTSPPSNLNIVVIANGMAVQPGTEARQVICSCLKQNSNVLLLYICNQLVQLLRIVSVWNPITVENRQINVSKGSSIVPPKSLHLIIQILVCLLTAQWGGWGKDGVGDVGVWVGVGVGAWGRVVACGRGVGRGTCTGAGRGAKDS